MTRENECRTDLLVVGGGLGGVAAALTALSAGLSVVITEETEWLGGQLTTQGVPPDEHPWIEMFGATHRYRKLRNSLRQYYRTRYPLKRESAENRYFNPGAGLVSKICVEPRVAAHVLDGMVLPHASSGRLREFRKSRVVSIDVDNDLARSATVESTQTQKQTTILFEYLIDATEMGEVLPLAQAEYVSGFESRRQTGEPSAPEESQPSNLQAFSVCMAFDHLDGRDFTIDKPASYDYWAKSGPEFWPGPQIGLMAPHPQTLEPLSHTFVPNPLGDPNAILADQSKDHGSTDLWLFRRLLARQHFDDELFASDIVLANWPMLDHLEGGIVDVPEDEAKTNLERARQQTLSMFYWLQTECPRPDGSTGYPGLRLRGDVLGTEDGLAMSPYIRESRRIQAMTTIVEQDISYSIRGDRGAVKFADTVGIGMYRIDLHPSLGGDNYIDVPSCPFQLPLGALIPVRLRNLLAGGKTIGTTHITNGAYRLHPVEWNAGEVAGLLAAFCIHNGVEPQEVHSNPDKLSRFQEQCVNEGIELDWPTVGAY